MLKDQKKKEKKRRKKKEIKKTNFWGFNPHSSVSMPLTVILPCLKIQKKNKIPKESPKQQNCKMLQGLFEHNIMFMDTSKNAKLPSMSPTIG